MKIQQNKSQAILYSFGFTLEKGTYKDTPENRKLGRVGATYGGSKKEDPIEKLEKLPTGRIFEDAKLIDSIFKKSKYSWSEVIEAFEKNKSNSRVEEVSILDVHITQPNIQLNKVKKMLGSSKLPTVDAVRFKDGEISIFDGHHRVATSWAQGRDKVKLNLVNL